MRDGKPRYFVSSVAAALFAIAGLAMGAEGRAPRRLALFANAAAQEETEKTAEKDGTEKATEEPASEETTEKDAPSGDEKADSKPVAKSDDKASATKAEAERVEPGAGEKDQKKKTEGDTAKEDAPPKKKKEPKKPKPPPIFRMYDGTRISGTPQMDAIAVETQYGELTVPRADLVRIRFAREKDPNLGKLIAAEIDKLQSEEFEVREEATTKLRQFGRDALKLLQKATKSDDEEVKNRATTLVKEIEEEGGEDYGDDEDATPISGEDDEVVTVKFTIKGKISERDFQLRSQYGTLSVHRKDIVSIVFQAFSARDAEFNVPANYFAPQNNWFESKVAVEKGDELRITARGTIQLHNYGWAVGPEGTPNIGGNQFKNFPAASLVGRIGKKGKPFLVAANYKGKADTKGKIMFALAFRGGSVSGAFQVKVQLKPQDE